jgi:hypothetical protein
MTNSSARRIPDSPLKFEGTLASLVDRRMQSVMPELTAVERVHSQLKRYCASATPLLLLRCENIKERGSEFQTENGAVIRWTDNTPAWAMHQAAYAGLSWSQDQFEKFIDTLPFHIFNIRGRSINTARWYVAHIFRVKPDRCSARGITPRERIARFIRNVHPANHFYVPDRPKGRGKLYGEDPRVIEYMAARNRERYGRIWSEFTELALAEEWNTNPDELGRVQISLGEVEVRPTTRHEHLDGYSDNELRPRVLDWTGNDQSGCQHSHIRNPS